MKLFLIELRNKTAYFFLWLVIVWIIIYLLNGNNSIHVYVLLQLFFLSFVGALLFYLFFTNKLMKNKSFTKRLTYFIISCAFIESALIYWFRLYGIEAVKSWIIFLLVVIILYVLSLGIFCIYSHKAGKRYTDLLKIYQQDNRIGKDT